ncbi:type IV secretion system DNA-binding domain-containing protein [Quatrionicoccus australiensis]|uniref:type IV secretion system DNA-binding domain-containing protein n=1 Tax=Quatrionicoccus australiensis TaxID=138118 RepID=UPI001CFC2C34|nr:type IV secretion system DNA-binding domain-containing protein [Quatrionicoccus australiensis]MCB4359583.1 type IV secretion system DNA-binding domain-containing protein [Quatrionicoccus australiensis]
MSIPGQRSKWGQLGDGADIDGNEIGQGFKAGLKVAAYSIATFTGAFAMSMKVACGGSGETSEWALYWKYNLARVLSAMPGDVPFTPSAMLSGKSPAGLLKSAQIYHAHFGISPYLATLLALGAASAVGYYLIKRYLKKGVEANADVFVRGAKLSSVEEVIARVRTKDPTKGWLGASDYTWVGGIPLAAGRAQYGILVAGAVGSGKTTAMLYLLDQVTARGKTMVVFDVVCEFTAFYYREDTDDVIMNPLDKRFPGWSIFNEIREKTDPDQLAALFLPIKDANDNTEVYFKTGAKIVIAWLIKLCIEQGTPTQTAFNKYVFNTSHKALHKLAIGTPAEMYLDPEAGGTGGAGFITSLRNALYVLTMVKDGPFSIKDFIWKGGDRRMFIPTPEAYAELLQPLTAMVFGVAIQASLDNRKMEQTPDDKIWFVADEFSSMGPVPSIYALATKGRKFGALMFAGMQSLVQVKKVMTPDDSEAFLSVMQNVLLMKVADSVTQERFSKEIGKAEMWRKSRAANFGENDAKDGRSINDKREEVPVVLPAEIGELSPNSGFLRLAGGYGTCFLSWPGFRPEKQSKDLIQIDGMELDPFANVGKVKTAPEGDTGVRTKAAQRLAAELAAAGTAAQVEVRADQANEAAGYVDPTEPSDSPNFQDFNGDYVPDTEPAVEEQKPQATRYKMR